MLDIPSISALVATGAVVVGVVFTYLEVRNLTKQRRTDLVMRLYAAFGSKNLLEEYKQVLTWKSEDYKSLSWGEGLQLLVFFEAIGVLLKEKLVDIALVDDFFSSPVILSWEKLQPLVEDDRSRFNRPQASEWFEYLYNEMKKREQRLQQIQQ